VDCDQLNFAIYAAMVYKYLTLGAYIPKQRSHELSSAMDKRIRELGGDIWYNTCADKILMKDGKVTGVVTTRGEVACGHVIACCSPNAVFGGMLEPENVPEQQRRMVNAREFGGRGFVLYLGLNRTAEQLGLKDYSYFIYESLDTKKEAARGRLQRAPDAGDRVLKRGQPRLLARGHLHHELHHTLYRGRMGRCRRGRIRGEEA
jgi:prolycopene isomerase